ADPLAAEAVGVRADAAVVGVARLEPHLPRTGTPPAAPGSVPACRPGSATRGPVVPGGPSGELPEGLAVLVAQGGDGLDILVVRVGQQSVGAGAGNGPEW